MITFVAKSNYPIIYMKKLLLPIIALVAMCHMTASAAQSVYYSQAANDPVQALWDDEVAKNDMVAIAFYVSAENASQFAGSQVTKMTIYSGESFNIANPQYPVSKNINLFQHGEIYFTYELGAEPFYTQRADLSSKPLAKNEITLTKPVTIQAGKAFYCGFRGNVTDPGDAYIPVDGLKSDNEDWAWCGNCKNGKWTWFNVASDFGNITGGITVTGDKMPQSSIMPIDISVSQGLFAGEDNNLKVYLRNMGINKIETIDFSCKIGSEAAYTNTVRLDKAANFGEEFIALLPGVPTKSVGHNIPVEFSITKVNGTDNPFAKNVVKQNADCYKRGTEYTANLLVEECTGTWCQWCPGGIEFMNRAVEAFEEGRVIPIAAHLTQSTSIDPMNCSTYLNWANTYSAGFPTAIVNRRPDFRFVPNTESIIEYAMEMLDDVSLEPTYATVAAKATLSDDKKNVNATVDVTFSFDITKAKYRVAFILTEDNVGPYAQTNGYDAKNHMFGWEKKGSPVSMTYNHVARYYKSYPGIENSLPATITGGKTMQYSTSIPATNVDNTANMNLVAIVMDMETGKVINSVMVPASKFTGINDVTSDADADADAVYYNLQGVRMPADQLTPGIYICRKGDKATKVLVR